MSEVKTMDEAIKKIRELEDRNRKLLVVVNKLWDAGYDVLNRMDNEIEELDYVMERDSEYKKLEDWTYEDGVGGENGLDPIVYGHKMVLDRLKFIYDSECFGELVDALDTVDEIKMLWGIFDGYEF